MGVVKLLDFEKRERISGIKNSDDGYTQSIDEKYNRGISRVVTETGSYKVSLLKDIFVSGGNYNLEPDYQRRITWNGKKRSKLIESLIMNIPIPPIYLYEKDYNQYEIMDGLQRVSAIIDFYKDDYALTGLEEWPELNGRKYSKLERTIKEGIDRRQLSVITLLKETALDSNQAEKIKRLVFERLNTGGVKLTGQEIRNAIFDGKGNNMCKELSEISILRRLWEMPESDIEIEDYDEYQDEPIELDLLYSEKQYKKLKAHTLYKRMGDVEIVLRFFAMRQIDHFIGSLSGFLDDNLRLLNTYSPEQLEQLKNIFVNTLNKAEILFGNYAFKLYKEEDWTAPLRMIYDPMMIALSNIDLSDQIYGDVESRVEQLKEFYQKNINVFGGKLQTKEYSLKRIELISGFLSIYES